MIVNFLTALIQKLNNTPIEYIYIQIVITERANKNKNMHTPQKLFHIDKKRNIQKQQLRWLKFETF